MYLYFDIINEAPFINSFLISLWNPYETSLHRQIPC